jgi:hypothetical protein
MPPDGPGGERHYLIEAHVAELLVGPGSRGRGGDDEEKRDPLRFHLLQPFLLTVDDGGVNQAVEPGANPARSR